MQRSISQVNCGTGTMPLYHAPQRDLVNIFPQLLTAVFNALRPDCLGEDYRRFMTDRGITEEQLATTVAKFADAFVRFTRDRDINSPMDAFAAEGFDPQSDVASLLWIEIGRAFVGGAFVSLRDVTLQGSESPYDVALLNLVSAGHRLAARLRGVDAQDLEVLPPVNVNPVLWLLQEHRVSKQQAEMIEARDQLIVNLNEQLRATQAHATELYQLAHQPVWLTILSRVTAATRRLFRRGPT